MNEDYYIYIVTAMKKTRPGKDATEEHYTFWCKSVIVWSDILEDMFEDFDRMKFQYDVTKRD